MKQQPVRGCQYDLEEDEQVEHVCRQERARETHELKLEHGGEMDAGAMPTCGTEDERTKPEDPRQKYHPGREPIQDERDPEGGWPVAGKIRDRSANVYP